MSEDHKNQLNIDNLNTDHIRAIRDDEVIQIGADLIPDDIDMFPRLIGTREMPFREAVAERFCGSLDPLTERDRIGATEPFESIHAKDIYGHLHGAVNGLPFPGIPSGYGWMLILTDNTADQPKIRVQRSPWPSKYYSVNTNNGNPHILIHLSAPFIPFLVGNPVFVEIIRHNLITSETSTIYKSVNPYMNGSIKTTELDLEIELPTNMSAQYQMLIRMY